MRFLIVDDSVTNCCVLRQVLTALCAEAKIEAEIKDVHTGKAALQEWLLWRPDVIWLDFHLPDISGVAIVSHNRSGLSQHPYLVSVTSDARDAALMKRVGADANISKPVTREAVAAIMQQVA